MQNVIINLTVTTNEEIPSIFQVKNIKQENIKNIGGYWKICKYSN
jgi:hypothetical protein